MTGRPSGRCAAREALKVIADVATKPNGVITNEWYHGVQVTVRDLARAALASPCCEGADQEQVKEALEDAHWRLVAIYDLAGDDKCRAALALLGSQNEKGGVTMRPRCGVFVCDQEATTTMRVLIPSQDERSLAPYDLPVCPEHEIATRPEPELSVVTEPS